jgi:hypothetical protein
MHHFEEFRIVRGADDESFDITYTNAHSGKSIIMNVPESGVFEDPDRILSEDEVELVAQRVGHTLSHSLIESLGLEAAGSEEALS